MMIMIFTYIYHGYTGDACIISIMGGARMTMISSGVSEPPLAIRHGPPR